MQRLTEKEKVVWLVSAVHETLFRQIVERCWTRVWRTFGTPRRPARRSCASALHSAHSVHVGECAECLAKTQLRHRQLLGVPQVLSGRLHRRPCDVRP